MLSLKIPGLMPKVMEAGPGVFPLRLTNGEYILAIKGSAELALAAKITGHIRFHLYDLTIGETRATGVITAIYDRPSSPLLIRTICSDPFNADLMMALSQESLSISIFDMHSSELYGGRWTISSGDRPSFMQRPVPPSLGPTLPIEWHVDMETRFGSLDDGHVINARLLGTYHVEDVLVMHLTEETLASQNAEGLGLYTSSLELENPGDANEAEIGRALRRLFKEDAVLMRPRTNKRPEFCDVLAAEANVVLAVHAKAMPRSEKFATESDERRSNRMDKQFRAALKQASGAERAFYATRETLFIGDAPIELPTVDTLLVHVLVITDKIPTLLDSWSKDMAPLVHDGMCVVLLDMPEFTNLTSMAKDVDYLIRVLMTLLDGFRKDTYAGQYTFGTDRLAVR